MIKADISTSDSEEEQQKYLSTKIVNACSLIHCILVDSSTVICWKSPFVSLDVQVYFVSFVLFLLKTVSKQCRP